MQAFHWLNLVCILRMCLVQLALTVAQVLVQSMMRSQARRQRLKMILVCCHPICLALLVLTVTSGPGPVADEILGKLLTAEQLAEVLFILPQPIGSLGQLAVTHAPVVPIAPKRCVLLSVIYLH